MFLLAKLASCFPPPPSWPQTLALLGAGGGASHGWVPHTPAPGSAGGGAIDHGCALPHTKGECLFLFFLLSGSLLFWGGVLLVLVFREDVRVVWYCLCVTILLGLLFFFLVLGGGGLVWGVLFVLISRHCVLTLLCSIHVTFLCRNGHRFPFHYGDPGLYPKFFNVRGAYVVVLG